MMYVNLDADEKRVVLVSLALREIPGKESSDRIDAMKEQLAIARKCLDAVKVAAEANVALKQKVAMAQANEATVLRACAALVQEAGKGALLPDVTVLSSGIRIYAPEVRAAVRTLGPAGKWLADRAEAIGLRGSKVADEQESAQGVAAAEMKLGAAIHKLREMVSGATAFVHAHSAPGSAARTHLKRKVHRKPADPNAPKRTPKKKDSQPPAPPESATEPPQPPAIVVPPQLPATAPALTGPANGALNGATGAQGRS